MHRNSHSCQSQSCCMTLTCLICASYASDQPVTVCGGILNRYKDSSNSFSCMACAKGCLLAAGVLGQPTRPWPRGGQQRMPSGSLQRRKLLWQLLRLLSKPHSCRLLSAQVHLRKWPLKAQQCQPKTLHKQQCWLHRCWLTMQSNPIQHLQQDARPHGDTVQNHC